MSDWKPKSVWDELLETLLGPADDRGERSFDPNLVLHMLLTAPLLMGLLMMVKRT